ncbi:MAG: exonuclease domain-containing protein [Pseudobdellovibrionaceae bacterium]
MMDLTRPWPEFSFVAFDTETSGAYAVGFEIVEFGAVKWKDGAVVDRLQFLLKPREPMSDFIIGIHGITNDMVANAMLMPEKVHEIKKFFSGSLLIAHHAAFDLGFLAYDFEKSHIPFPEEPVLCSSLLSQKLIHGVKNHKLQNLIQEFNLQGGAAHRAEDDAYSCLQVALMCFEKMPPGATIQEILKIQEKVYYWNRFSILSLNQNWHRNLMEAILAKRNIEILYKKQMRSVFPLGIVRTVDGDYLSAICQRDCQRKRFYLIEIKDAM